MTNSTTLAEPPLLAITVGKSSKLKRSLLVLLFLATAVGLSELFCGYVLDLGNPPLYQMDSAMEFHLQPSKAYSRFHNRFYVNRYAMRADDFPPQKSSSNELRVLVIGDSILYGGVRIDQAEIGTELLKRNLQRELGRPVVVGNASAKGWGPPDELGYLKRYGTLDADVVVLELSSHDYEDVPRFVPLVGISPAYPDKKPLGALADLFTTYVLPRLQQGSASAGVDMRLPNTNAVPSQRNIAECSKAERDLFFLARNNHAKVVLVQHLSAPELTGLYQPGYYVNQAIAKESGVPYVDDADELRTQTRSGESPFYDGDPLHLNRLGQEPLAHALQKAVHLALESK